MGDGMSDVQTVIVSVYCFSKPGKIHERFIYTVSFNVYGVFTQLGKNSVGHVKIKTEIGAEYGNAVSADKMFNLEQRNAHGDSDLLRFI